MVQQFTDADAKCARRDVAGLGLGGRSHEAQ
jgi:hypothetical protein